MTWSPRFSLLYSLLFQSDSSASVQKPQVQALIQHFQDTIRYPQRLGRAPSLASAAVDSEAAASIAPQKAFYFSIDHCFAIKGVIFTRNHHN